MELAFVNIPRMIYSLWLQGREQAPEIVRLNFQRWELLNPGYQLKVLERRDVSALLADVDIDVGVLPPQAVSDVVRAKLLLDHGGIWVDASLYPVKPLDEWLPTVLTNVGFFAFERPGPDRPISSWFLVSTPNHLIFQELWKEIIRFWSMPRQLIEGIPLSPVASVSPEGPATFPYFWFHYLFDYLLNTNQEIASLWDGCIKYSADRPHALQLLLGRKSSPPRTEVEEALASAPVQKLNWRDLYPLDILSCGRISEICPKVSRKWRVLTLFRSLLRAGR